MNDRKSHSIFCSLLFWLLCGTFSPLWGQVEFMDEKNKITEVKRNPAYVYGEGIAETMEEALEIAEGSLKSEILRVISENDALQNTTVFEVGTVRQNSEKVILKRGTLERVFLFVAIDCIQPGKYGITINFRKEESAKETDVIEDILQNKEAEDEPETDSEMLDVLKEILQTEEITREEESVLILDESESMEINSVQNPELEIESNLLRKIISVKDMDEMEKIFRAAKDARQLMWGNVTSTINPAWNLLIYDRAGVKAVLEKGTDNRLNYLTGQVELLSDYENDPKIWFILYE